MHTAFDVQVEMLLGRRQVDQDLDAAAGCLNGRRVLVTGAGGSIGAELCRQIQQLGPAELQLLDRDESALHAVQLSLDHQQVAVESTLLLADLRDARTINQIFRTRRPDVVFHAAALKHLPILQRHPGEALQTNIWGTLTVLEAAQDVECLVNISTDKAADPINVLGYSKRIAERLTAHMAQERSGRFLSVRFGNVLGSRGSVLPAFAAQIAAGGPITVTHPEVTRYFMTIREAAHLLLQAAAIGRDGEALVLDMGEPVRIVQVAEHLARLAGSPIDIEYIGLRPGEKLHETLFSAGEFDKRPLHPLVSHLAVPPLDPAMVRDLDPHRDPATLAEQLALICRADLDADPVSECLPARADASFS